MTSKLNNKVPPEPPIINQGSTGQLGASSKKWLVVVGLGLLGLIFVVWTVGSFFDIFTVITFDSTSTPTVFFDVTFQLEFVTPTRTQIPTWTAAPTRTQIPTWTPAPTRTQIPTWTATSTPTPRPIPTQKPTKKPTKCPPISPGPC